MRKYYYIFKYEIMSNMQYLSNMLIGYFGYVIHIFIFMCLWQYLYSDPSSLINGYSYNQMIWYIIFTELLWSCTKGRTLCKKISADVKGGNIAYNINKPYSYIGYIVSNSFGGIVVTSAVYVVLAFILGYLFLHSFPSLSVLSVLLLFISSVLSILINILFTVSIGLFSFYIEDSSPFYWVYQKFLLIVGTLFPLEFFPKIIRPILNYSPSYVISYGPAKMFVNFDLSIAIKTIIIQVVYVIIAYLICSLIYRKGVRKLNVNGG